MSSQEVAERLARIETSIDHIKESIIDIKKEVENICDNHLATINKRLRKLEKGASWTGKDYATVLASFVALIIAALPYLPK